jgi:hypothetical protein
MKLMLAAEPAHDHDCENCIFVGADFAQPGEPPVNQVDMYVQMYLVSRPLRRIRWGDEKGLWPKKRGRLGPCGDCAALPGQYHAPNCDMEQCPVCGGQALSCDCQLEFMSPAEIAEWIADGALDEDAPP